MTREKDMDKKRANLLDWIEKGIMVQVATTGHIDSDMIADIILEREARILAPLKKYMALEEWEPKNHMDAMEETLRLNEYVPKDNSNGETEELKRILMLAKDFRTGDNDEDSMEYLAKLIIDSGYRKTAGS